MISPLAQLTIDMTTLEREVKDRERLVALLRRREIAARELAAKGYEPAPNTMSSVDVIKMVATRHGLSDDAIRGYDKRREVIRARHEVFYLLAQQVKADGSPRLTLVQIGVRVSLIGRPPFDHSTVRNGILRHKARLEEAEKPAPAKPKKPAAGERARAGRAKILHTLKMPVVVCLLPAGEDCGWCGARGGAACLEGAKRG